MDWLTQLREMRETSAVILTWHPGGFCSCAVIAIPEMKGLAYATGADESEVVGACFVTWDQAKRMAA